MRIADNTIVIYTTDNGAEVFSWPDGGTTPFRGEKNTNWEGGYRVRFVVRWPGVIKPGAEDQPDHLARGLAPNDPGCRGRGQRRRTPCWKGTTVAGTSFKVHLDGYNLLPYFRGERLSGHARSSSTGPTTGIPPACATKTGRWCFWNSTPRG